MSDTACAVVAPSNLVNAALRCCSRICLVSTRTVVTAAHSDSQRGEPGADSSNYRIAHTINQYARHDVRTTNRACATSRTCIDCVRDDVHVV